jgi:lipopolysaccharide export LptBFGC system permease protein LptF
MLIWQRYLFGKLARTFFFFLLCLLIFYVAVDFSIQGAHIGENYLRRVSKLGSLFFSLSFLLAMLRTLLELSAHREILALQTAGLSSKKLLAPFFLFASLLTLASTANFQWISPDGESQDKKGKVFSILLEDGSELVYQSYEPSKRELFDLFWIRSFNEIWYMKTLLIAPKPVEGRFVDLFLRNGPGELEKAESFTLRPFPEISLEADAPLQCFVPYENRSLKALLLQAMGKGRDKKASASHLHYKIATSLFPFMMILAGGPFAMRFSKGRSSLLFIAGALFAFVGMMTLLDAMLILAENQVLSPGLAIWGPCALSFVLGLYLFFRKMY